MHFYDKPKYHYQSALEKESNELKRFQEKQVVLII